MTACTSPEYPGGPRCPRTATKEIIGIKPGPLGDEGEQIAVKCDYHAGTFMAGLPAGYGGYTKVLVFEL